MEDAAMTYSLSFSLLRRFIAAGFCLLLIFTNPSKSDTVRAAPADSFVDFLGVQGQLHRDGTIWETQATTWRARLVELGIRYMRSAVVTSENARINAGILYRDYGIKLNVVVRALKADGTLNPRQITPQLDYLKQQVGMEKIASIEGPNEYSSIKYEGNTDWATELRNFQIQLFREVNADPRSSSVPVIAPTIWWRVEEDYAELGDLSDGADFGNLHYYNAGRKPGVYNRVRFFGDSGIVSPMSMAISNAQITRPGRPVFVTETGYNIRANSQSEAYVPERTSAKYMLRLVSEFFLRRSTVRKAYIYSLIDDNPERQLGLLRRDFSRRPSFYAIKNAVRLLADRGSPFSTQSLTYTLTGDLTDIRHVVLQKRDRRFYVLIWNDAVSWDRTRFVEVDPPTRQLTLDVSNHAFKTMKIYLPTALGLADPNRGTLPVQTVTEPRTIVLNVPDHVLIAEFIP